MWTGRLHLFYFAGQVFYFFECFFFPTKGMSEEEAQKLEEEEIQKEEEDMNKKSENILQELENRKMEVECI